MNVRYAIYILLLLLSFGMVACSADSSTEVSEERIPVAFLTEFSAPTRASTIDNVWNSGDTIAVNNGTKTYMYTASTTSAEGNFVKLTFSDYNEQFFWPTEDKHWTFYAWYPYNDGEKQTSVSVADDQRGTSADTPADEGTLKTKDYHNYDLLYATAVPEYRRRVYMTFYHQLAHIIVKATVTPNTGNAHEQITSIQLGSSNVAVTGDITMGTTGASVTTPSVAWTVPATDETSTSTINMRHAATSGALYTYECMLPPQTIGDANTPLFTINTSYTYTYTDNTNTEQTETLTRTYLYKGPYTFLPGYEHTFTFTIDEVGILKVQNLTIVSWGTGTGGTGTVK